MRSRNLFMQPSYNVAQPRGERRGLKGGWDKRQRSACSRGKWPRRLWRRREGGRAVACAEYAKLHWFASLRTNQLPPWDKDRGAVAVWNYGSCYGRLILTRRVCRLWPRQVRIDVQIVFAGDIKKSSVQIESSIEYWNHIYIHHWEQGLGAYGKSNK